MKPTLVDKSATSKRTAAKRMQQRHGIVDARKLSPCEHEDQTVTVDDSGTEVHLRAGFYGAALTSAQARYIGELLVGAADRIDDAIESTGSAD